MAFVKSVSQLRPAVIVSLIIADVVKSGRVTDIPVPLDVALAYISVCILNRVSVLREVANLLNIAAKVFLYFDPSDLFLAVAINLGSNIILSLHQSALNI